MHQHIICNINTFIKKTLYIDTSQYHPVFSVQQFDNHCRCDISVVPAIVVCATL